MNDLLCRAQIEQRHLALESVPVDVNPPDLAAAFVDARSERESFRLHGYIRAPRTARSYLHQGAPVAVDFIAWGASNFSRDRLPLRGGRSLPFAEVQIEETAAPWWFAIVEGNTVMAARWFRERGFLEAFSGSPTFCEVRAVAATDPAGPAAAEGNGGAS